MCEWFLENMDLWEEEVDVCLYIYTKITMVFGKIIDQERLRRESQSLMRRLRNSVLPPADKPNAGTEFLLGPTSQRATRVCLAHAAQHLLPYPLQGR